MSRMSRTRTNHQLCPQNYQNTNSPASSVSDENNSDESEQYLQLSDEKEEAEKNNLLSRYTTSWVSTSDDDNNYNTTNTAQSSPNTDHFSPNNTLLTLAHLNKNCKTYPRASLPSLFLKGTIKSVLATTAFFLMYAVCCLLTPGKFSDNIKTSGGWTLGILAINVIGHFLSICKIRASSSQKIIRKRGRNQSSFTTQRQPSFREVYRLIIQENHPTDVSFWQKHGLFLFMYGLYTFLNFPTCWVYKDVGGEAINLLGKNIIIPTPYSAAVFPQAGWIGFGSNLTLNGYCGFFVLMSITVNFTHNLFLDKKMKKYRNYFKSQRILLSLIFITSLLSASPFFLLPFDDPSLSYPEQLALAFTSAVINTVNNSLGSSSCIEYGKVFIKKFQQLSEWIYQQLTCSNHDRIQLPTTSDEIQLTDQFLTAALDYMKEDNSKQRFCQTLLNFIENADSMNPASSMNQPKNTARSLLCFAFSMLACAPLLTITTPYFYVVMDQAHQKVLSALSFKKESPATFLLSASIYLPFFTLVMKLGVNTMSKIFDCLSNIIDSLRNREVDLYQSLLAIPDLITFLIIATSAATVIVLTDLYREEKILSLFIEVIGFKMLANIEFWTTATVNGIGALTLLNFMKSHLGKVLVASGNALNRCCCPLLGDSFIKAGQKLKTLYEHPVKNNVKVGNVFFYALKKLSITSVSKKEIQELVALEQNDYASAIPFSIR